MLAARRWALDAPASEESSTVLEEARLLGLDDASIDVFAGALPAAVDVEIFPENWDAVLAFLMVDTQWRVASFGGGFTPAGLFFVGLDYTAARISLEIAGVVITAALWGQIRVMESAARAALNGVG